MADIFTAIAVLYGKPGDEFLMVGCERHRMLVLPVRPAGTPKPADMQRDGWQYEWKDGDGDILRMHPSVLCLDDPEPKFHTDFAWTTRFERVFPGSEVDPYTRYYELNPALRRDD